MEYVCMLYNQRAHLDGQIDKRGWRPTARNIA